MNIPELLKTKGPMTAEQISNETGVYFVQEKLRELRIEGSIKSDQKEPRYWFNDEDFICSSCSLSYPKVRRSGYLTFCVACQTKRYKELKSERVELKKPVQYVSNLSEISGAWDSCLSASFLAKPIMRAQCR